MVAQTVKNLPAMPETQVQFLGQEDAPLLLSCFSRVRLCATPWTAAYQAPPSMGFSGQQYWSGVPLPSPGRCPREGNGCPLQYSCLGNSMDRGAWRVTVHGVAKRRTQLSNTHTHTHTHTHVLYAIEKGSCHRRDLLSGWKITGVEIWTEGEHWQVKKGKGVGESIKKEGGGKTDMRWKEGRTVQTADRTAAGRCPGPQVLALSCTGAEPTPCTHPADGCLELSDISSSAAPYPGGETRGLAFSFVST